MIDKALLPIYLLTLSCPDRMGIVREVSGFLVENGCNIVDSAQYGESENGRFFMRVSFHSERGRSLEALEQAFRPIAKTFDMEARLYDSLRPMKTVIMVSRMGHCLNDLLFRYRIKALPIDIQMVVSNHRDFEEVTEQHGIPFHCLPVTPENKAEQEKALSALVDKHDIELIVLARYMQVLSSDLCARYSGRIINIHHSFLPSFKGAKPYHRAHARGVKMIGATAHYVTQDLDEGPIIEQCVERVGHAASIDDMIATGRDTESVALARAVKWHAEHRVLLNGNRTIVFN